MKNNKSTKIQGTTEDEDKKVEPTEQKEDEDRKLPNKEEESLSSDEWEEEENKIADRNKISREEGRKKRQRQ